MNVKRLTQSLADRSIFPVDFVDWESSSLDFDEFYRFRRRVRYAYSQNLFSFGGNCEVGTHQERQRTKEEDFNGVEPVPLKFKST